MNIGWKENEKKNKGMKDAKYKTPNKNKKMEKERKLAEKEYASFF